MADYTATVASIYDAFRTGDIPAILETLADDVRWEEWTDNSAQKAGVPWLQRRDGKAGALEFFKIAGQMAIHEFRVLSLLAGGQQVVAEVVIDATGPSGGRYQTKNCICGPSTTRARSFVCGTTSTRQSISRRVLDVARCDLKSSSRFRRSE